MNKRGRKANPYLPTESEAAEQLNDMLNRWEICDTFRADFYREAEQRRDERDE